LSDLEPAVASQLSLLIKGLYYHVIFAWETGFYPSGLDPLVPVMTTGFFLLNLAAEMLLVAL
jgi:hypothetical protein